MKLSEDDKNTILMHMGEIDIEYIEDPVVMVDEWKDGITSEVMITSVEGFELFSVDNGMWDLYAVHSDSKRRCPPFYDICVVPEDYKGAFSVTKDEDPEFIEECKQAIQLGSL